MRKPKVYGGHPHIQGHGQVRAIMAGTQAEIAKALHTTVGYIKTYWSQTGNDVELAVALAEPGTVFWADKNKYARKVEDYQKLE